MESAVAVRDSFTALLADRTTARICLLAMLLFSLKVLRLSNPLRCKVKSVSFNLEQPKEVKRWVGKTVRLLSTNEQGVVIGYSDHLKRFDVSIAPMSRRVFCEQGDLILDPSSEPKKHLGLRMRQVIYNARKCGVVSGYKSDGAAGGSYLITEEDGSHMRLVDKHTKTSDWFLEKLSHASFCNRHGIFVDQRGNDLIEVLCRELQTADRHEGFRRFAEAKPIRLTAVVSLVLAKYPDEVLEAIFARPRLNKALLLPITGAIDEYIRELLQTKAKAMAGKRVRITARRFAELGLVGTIQDRIASKHRFVIRADHPGIGSVRLTENEFEEADLVKGARVTIQVPEHSNARGTVESVNGDEIQVNIDELDHTHSLARDCLTVLAYPTSLTRKIERQWLGKRVRIGHSGLLWDKTGTVERCNPEDIGMCKVLVDSFFLEELCIELAELSLI